MSKGSYEYEPLCTVRLFLCPTVVRVSFCFMTAGRRSCAVHVSCVCVLPTHVQAGHLQEVLRVLSQERLADLSLHARAVIIRALHKSRLSSQSRYTPQRQQAQGMIVELLRQTKGLELTHLKVRSPCVHLSICIPLWAPYSSVDFHHTRTGCTEECL